MSSVSRNAKTARALIDARGTKKRSISEVDLTNEKESCNHEQSSAKKTKPATTTSATSSNVKTATLATKNTSTAPPQEIFLDGELDDTVPVYESCQEIRRKMTAYLSKPGVTLASFVRELNAQSHIPDAPMSANVLKTFRGKRVAWLATLAERIIWGMFSSKR